MTARDLALDANGDLAIVGQDLAPLVADVPAIVSDVKASILFVTGEWFLDTARGIPWFQAFARKGQPLAQLRAAILTTIAQRRGITRVQSVAISMNSSRRTGSVTWSAFADATLLTGTVQVSP